MPVILGAYYGLRRSEALGLKWDAIDFDTGVICIRHKVISVNNELIGMDVMKTKSSYRSLPLIPAVAEELKREKSRQEEMQRVLRGSYNKQYLGYICVDAIGNLIRPQYVTEHFGVILKQHKMKKIRFHDLRHSCASLLLANEVPMKMIQDWLGHSDMGTTANIYSHIDSNSKQGSANAIGNALSGL
jgi:integrase